jgi:hypothetical protein
LGKVCNNAPSRIDIDLGLNLYSNIPSVLAEIIANAWDADADKVEITTSNEI